MTVLRVLIVVLVIAPLLAVFVQYVWPPDWPTWVGSYLSIALALIVLAVGIPRIRRYVRGWRGVALAFGLVAGAALFYVLYIMLGLNPR